MREFIVARNPEPASTLPYLLFVPLDAVGGMWLKAKEAWPRAARVYCHPAETPDVATLEVLERVPVASCTRRGPAIDLLLARGVNKRSQFIFTTFRRRPVIFWQTPKAALAARPGVRVPFGRAQAMESVIVDTRERYGYRFHVHDVPIERRALRAGDYALEVDNAIVAVVERKTIEDFAKGLTDGSLAFVMAELATLPNAAVVVEGTYSALLRHKFSRPGFLPDLVARLAVRFPSVPIVFAESRKFGEEWTFRFLHAARSQAQSPGLPLVSAAPPLSPEPAKKRRRRQAPKV